jgi:uncharacterized delta-60 repeat protein
MANALWLEHLEQRTLLNAGTLDPTFGTGGKVLTDFTGSLDSSGQVVLLQTDGKVVVAGSAANGAGSDIALARYKTDGSLDVSFGAGGKVLTPVGSHFSGTGGAALLSDGTILVAGSATTPHNSFVLAHYSSDGKLDPSFGTAGIIVAPLPSLDTLGGTVNRPVGLLVQADGRFLVAASASGVILAHLTFPVSGFVLARYNADGSADDSFGAGGQIAGLGFATLEVHAIVLQSDQKILLAGTEAAAFEGPAQLAVMRLNPDGRLDTSFGNGGTFTGSFNNFTDARTLTIQLDQKIVIAGSPTNFVSNGDGFELARLNPDGTVDSSFGNSGLVVTSFGANAMPMPSHLITQPDGKLLVAGGLAAATGSTFVLARYSMSGTLDTSFGMAGVQTTAFGPADSAANDVLLAGDQIVVVGRAGVGGTHDIGLARYNADGNPDGSFGAGGKVTTDFTGPLDSQAEAAVLQGDGKIVVVGSAGNGVYTSFALARYNPDGSLDGHFGNGGQVVAHLSSDPLDTAEGVVIQPGGKVVVVGVGTTATNSSPNTILARYTADGNLDSSFGKGGTVIVPGFSLARVAVQPDGKLVVALPQASLMRFTADGSPDPSFAGNGQAALSLTDVTGIVVQGDGEIVATRDSVGFSGPTAAVARSNPDGTPDLSFGAPDFNGSTEGRLASKLTRIDGVAVQANGKIVVVGTADSAANGGTVQVVIGLTRLRTDGSLDGSFGSGGQVTLSFATASLGTAALAGAVAIEPNGLIVVAGPVQGGGFGLAVLRPDGTPDPAIGTGGMVTTAFVGADDTPAAVVLQGDGNIIVAGSAGNGSHHSFALARYLESLQTDDGQFVSGLYQDLLKRSADFAGAAGFQQAVDSARDQALTPVAASLVTSAEGRSDLISRFYSQYLGRTPSAAEISPFVAALQQGVTPELVQASIAGSPEYFQHQGSTNEAWLRGVYLNVLGRPPDAASQGLLNLVNQGLPRDQAAAFLLSTTEYRSRLITEVYAADLGRSAGPADINFWLPLLSQGSAGAGQPSTDERFLTAVLGSAEYFQKQGGTDLGWIDGVYSDVLNRAPDPTGLGAAEGALLAASTAARQADALAVATSGEYRANLVAGYYQQLLGCKGSASEINYWVGLLQSGVQDEQVIAAFVASDEYYQNAGGTNAAWLDRAYRDLLGRPRGVPEVAFLNALAGGATHLQVAASIVASGEYRQRLVQQFYSTFLGRTGSDGEINGWVQVLAQGARDEDVAAAILASGEFFQRSL